MRRMVQLDPLKLGHRLTSPATRIYTLSRTDDKSCNKDMYTEREKRVIFLYNLLLLIESLSFNYEPVFATLFEQLGVFSSQVFQDSPRDKIWRRKNCNALYLTLTLQV